MEVRQQSASRRKLIRKIVITAGLLCASAFGQTQLSSSATVAQINNRIFVDGTRYPLTQAGIQQAFTDACAVRGANGAGGTVVYIPPGLILSRATSGQAYLITCALQIQGAGIYPTVFAVLGSDSSVPVFRIKPSAIASQGHLSFKNFQITGDGTAGDAFLFDGSQTPEGAINGPHSVFMEKVFCTGLNPNAYCINQTGNAFPNGNQWFFHLMDNVFNSGTRWAPNVSGDSILLEHNSFNSVGSNTACAEVTSLVGSSHFTMINNNGGCAGGFFVSHGTTQCKILYNQIEQAVSSTEANSAMIDLMGDAYTIDGCEIRGNNINQHTFASVGIRLGNATHTTIAGNVISMRPGGAGILLTPESHDSVIPFNEYIGAGTASAIHNPGHISAYAARGPEGKAAAPTFSFVNHPRTGWYSARGVLQASVDGSNSLSIARQGVQVESGQIMGWSSGGLPGSSADAALSRCGAACIAVGTGAPGNTAGRIRGGSAVLGSATILGDLTVKGTIFKSAGGFKIDDPLDPRDKYLNHSFVESPDMKNIYDGVAVLNGRGEAEVSLPAYFEALNKDFRYQLTCIGGEAQVYVAREIQNNRFLIAGGTPGLKISWQVTGTRNDEYARTHRIPVEEMKAGRER